MKNNSMRKRDGLNISLWQIGENIAVKKNASQDKIYDVLVVGGGITGLSTALNLQRNGKQCLLVEAHHLGYGTTGGTTAHLNTFLDATYPEIDRDFGEEASTLLASASKRMIIKIKENIDEFNIDADFEYRHGYLFSQNEKESEQLKEIYESAKRAGVSVSEVDENGLAIACEHSLKFENQAQFHPIEYLTGLSRAFRQFGGEIQENVRITDTSHNDGVHIANFEGGYFKAKHLVWATHIPPGINLLSFRNAPYRSYVLGVELTNEDYPKCLAYDMQEPYHYFRSHDIEDKKHLIIGGSDHKTGHEDPEKAFSELESYARENFQIKHVAFRWSSQYYIPVDGLPYIGHMPGSNENVYVATGFNGNGMIFGSLSAEIICDLILGIENELEKLLSPSRLKPVAGFSEFVKENADVAYRFLSDRFGLEVLDSIKQLENNEGKLASINGEKVALYKDGNGKVHALNPTCTHAGCIVNWNASERSWDCPCHGGRFDIDGQVLTGPPRAALTQISIADANTKKNRS